MVCRVTNFELIYFRISAVTKISLLFIISDLSLKGSNNIITNYIINIFSFQTWENHFSGNQRLTENIGSERLKSNGGRGWGIDGMTTSFSLRFSFTCIFKVFYFACLCAERDCIKKTRKPLLEVRGLRVVHEAADVHADQFPKVLRRPRRQDWPGSQKNEASHPSKAGFTFKVNSISRLFPTRPWN